MHMKIVIISALHGNATKKPHSSPRTREMGAQIKWTENRSSRSVTLYC